MVVKRLFVLFCRVQKKRQKTVVNKSRNQLIREAEMAGLRKK